MGYGIKQYNLKQTVDKADWLIAESIYLTPRPHGKWLRSMKEPWKKQGILPDTKAFNYPGHMDDYVETDNDNGGLHVNSGIPNQVFYIVRL